MKKLLWLWLLQFSLLPAISTAQSTNARHDAATIGASGGTITVGNPDASESVSFEEKFAGSPATASVIISGCKIGGTCDTLDTYTTVTNAIRSPSISKAYDYFSITASWTGGTNVSVTVNSTLPATARNGGSGGGGAPTGSAGGDLSGSYPNPTVVSVADVNAGTLPAANGGAGAVNGALKANGSGAVSQAACSDLSNAAASCSTDTTSASNISSGTIPAARLPNPSASTLGGVESLAATTHQWINTISTSGVPASTQPACSDLSNSATSCSTDATNAANIGSGTLPAGRLPALTGDATTSAGATAVTVKQIHDNVTSINNASSPYTVLSTDSYLSCDATAGAVTINLPAATGTGREISIKKIDSSGNACTPTRAGSDTIDSGTTYSLTSQYASSKIVDALSGSWHRSHVNQLGGDLTGISTSATVAKVNGNTPGGTCTNQVVTSVNSSAVPSCSTVTTAMIGTLAAGSNGLATSATTDTTSATNISSGTLANARGGIGKVTLTQPATGSTVTVLDGKTLTANNTLTLAGTDSTTLTFPGVNANIHGTLFASVGNTDSLNCPNNTTSNFATTYTIPANYLVANKVLRVTLGFVVTTTATVPQFGFRLQIGGTNVYLTAPLALTGSWAGAPGSVTFLIQGSAAAGASAAVYTHTLYGPTTNSAMAPFGGFATGTAVAQPVNLATNGTLAIQPVLFCSANTAGNSVTLQQFLVEAIN